MKMKTSSLNLLVLIVGMTLLPFGVAHAATVDQSDTEPLTETIQRLSPTPMETSRQGGGYGSDGTMTEAVMQETKKGDWVEMKQKRHGERVMRGGFVGSASSRSY